jgi:hypothetical protein
MISVHVVTVISHSDRRSIRMDECIETVGWRRDLIHQNGGLMESDSLVGPILCQYSFGMNFALV